MPSDLIILINYLKASEAESLKSELNSNKINYITKAHGATTGYEDDDYYQIMVAREDYSRAKVVANKFRARTFVKSRQCPKCKSMQYEPVTGLNFFQRILYWGTTPVRCKKCKTRYVI